MERTKLRGITVAGLRLAIEAPPALPWHWPEGVLTRFATSTENADLHVGVRVGEAKAPPQRALRYDSEGGIFDVAREGREFVIALRIRGALQRVARFDEGFRWGEVVVLPDSLYARACYYPLAYPLDELIFLHKIVREGGLMLHSCGILRDGDALLFAGPSGSGKTTISRLMRKRAGASVLSDDRVVLRPDGSEIRIFGTPWHGDGELSSTDSARLRGIHVIRHAGEILAEPLCGASAACAVLENAFLPAHDPIGADTAVDFVANLVKRVPVIRLGFPNDDRVVRYAWGSSSTAVTRPRGRSPAHSSASSPRPSAPPGS
jgi:hypothetical protein